MKYPHKEDNNETMYVRTAAAPHRQRKKLNHNLKSNQNSSVFATELSTNETRALPNQMEYGIKKNREMFFLHLQSTYLSFEHLIFSAVLACICSVFFIQPTQIEISRFYAIPA